MKWAKKQGLKGRIIEKKCMSKGGGIKSAIIEFEYKYAYGYFLGEKGTHRMITSHPESLSEVVYIIYISSKDIIFFFFY